jgi:hypothetical protein
MVGPAARLKVGERGLSSAGHWVDVVPFQAIPPAAALLDTTGPVETGDRTQLEGGSEFGGNVSAEVGHSVNLLAVVEDGLEKGVVGAPAYD